MKMARDFSGLLFLAIVVSQCVFVQSQCKLDNIDNTKPNSFPNIFNITDLSYSLTVEANMKLQQKTFYVTESYDKEFARGKVDLLHQGKTRTILYFNETNEVFVTKDADCQTFNMNEAYELPFDEFDVYEWRGDDAKQPILGPSNLLRFGYQQSLKNLVFKEKDTQVVRGIKTNVWKLCDNNNQLTIRYFFTDPQTSNGFGIRGRPVPSRITVQGINGEGSYEIDHTYDFVNFQVFVKDIANAFKIPKMIGCKRLAKNLKTPPSLNGKDFYLEAEVVYQPWKNSNYSYVSTITLAMDAKSQHLAYNLNTWKASKNVEIAEPGENVKIIWDLRNTYKYYIDESAQSCSVDNEELLPQLKFPDGQMMDLSSVNFILRNETVIKSYQYLGEDVERGIPVSVFENDVTELKDFDFSDIMITRYYLSDDALLNTDFTEKNALMKIVYSNLNDNGQFFGLVVFNIYAFTTTVKDKRTLFDVTPCFQDNDKSKWVQLTFPMREYKSEDIIPHIPYIEDDFLDLMGAPLKISPLRIPKIMVDVDSDNIYITFLILERPDFMLDFASQGKYGLEDNSLSQGITTQVQCAKACLERDTCLFFSYCGAICSLADEDPDVGGQKQSDQCEMFLHDKFDTSLPTMDELSANIASSVEMGTIEMSLTGSPKPMTFVALGYKEGLAFGINGINSRREEDVRNRFSISVLGHKFDETVSNLVKPMGVQSMSSCRRLCLNNPECESLSFCQATSECSLSTLHKEEIENTHIKQNWQCMIMSRVYVDYFERYPGFILAQTALKALKTNTDEACAKACVEESTFKCRSFDFCAQAEESCLLHGEHFLNIKNDENKIKISQSCLHFSKKLVYDFVADLGNQIVGDNAVILKDVSTEECAKYCLDDGSINCRTFDWCMTGEVENPTRICRLFSKTKSEMGTKKAARCKVYEQLAQSTPPQEEGYKKSTVGGVGFFVFLVGLAIGVGGMFAFGYYRANRR